MAQKNVVYKIQGTAPLIMHNGKLADPLYQYTKAMKEITSKRKKTEADLVELARLEWYGSLYVEKGKIVLPSYVLEAGLINASKKNRQGQQSQAGMYCDKNSILQFPDMDKSFEELWGTEEHRFSASVRVQRAKIMRMRAVFPEWGCDVSIIYDDTLVNPRDVESWMKIAGYQVGLCDWRPRYGRFELV